jgi:tetratricopeptide (TPR) repeat protein
VSKTLAEQLLVQAEKSRHPVRLMEAHHAMGATHYALGEFAQARAELEAGLAVDESEDLLLIAKRDGQDPIVMNRFFLGFVFWFLGFADRSEEQIWCAIARAEKSDDIFSRAFAHVGAASMFAFRCSAQDCARQAESALVLAKGHGFDQLIAWGSFLYHWATGIGQPTIESVEAMRRNRDAYEATGAKVWITRQHSMMAEAYAAIGQVDEGLSLLAEASARVHESGERFFEAEISRLKGELLLKKAKDRVKAEECFQQAIALAEQQQAKSLELRATVSLCRLWQSQGRPIEAQRRLWDIYDWFTEGFDKPDLIAAQTLLQELAGATPPEERSAEAAQLADADSR